MKVAVKGREMSPVCLTASSVISNMGGTELGSLSTSSCLLSLLASRDVVKVNLLPSSCLSLQQGSQQTNNQMYFLT